MKVAFSSSFKRAFKRRIAGNVEREERFRTKLKSFTNNPFEATLKTHKLSGKLKDYWSFSIEYNLRIIFYFSDKENVVFVDIGSHKEVY
ncbi:MAG: type II toxin-antitoxin system mRNA interferase toxin, RelE/StbE family [Acidobacteria bacterium]|nr:type II toxin-antitoxin system mRNA interferase toxin, RelE/StbE family [Acidobacteriota bacterium]MCA1639731.1 type II toxin-antitoxin system mRNA interferase toxin, RelE/StbE family [Acidobacteriota bacterium]